MKRLPDICANRTPRPEKSKNAGHRPMSGIYRATLALLGWVNFADWYRTFPLLNDENEIIGRGKSRVARRFVHFVSTFVRLCRYLSDVAATRQSGPVRAGCSSL